MRDQRAPRYQGKITSWTEERGFGFIAPNGGGAAVFVHIKSFASRGPRPAEDDVVTYELTVNEKGQQRAGNVAFVRHRGAPQADTRTGANSVITAIGFLGLIGACVLTGLLPSSALGLYVGASLVAFIAYGLDKSAARNNRWRTKESTLHMLGLVGGWPGALVAQQVFRHKSTKQSFRTTFWGTVVLNCAALAWFLSPFSASALRSLSG